MAAEGSFQPQRDSKVGLNLEVCISPQRPIPVASTCHLGPPHKGSTTSPGGERQQVQAAPVLKPLSL